MKRHWVCLQLSFEATKDINYASLRAALSGNALLIVTFSSLFIDSKHYCYLVSYDHILLIEQSCINNF